MIVLSRTRDERIIITEEGKPSNQITIVILDIRGEKIRLGIHAPAHFTIDREEVYLSKQRESGSPIQRPRRIRKRLAQLGRRALNAR